MYVNPRSKNRPTTPNVPEVPHHARNVEHLRVGSTVVTSRPTHDAHGNLARKFTESRIDRVKLSEDAFGNEVFLVTFAPTTITARDGETIITCPSATIGYKRGEVLRVKS